MDDPTPDPESHQDDPTRTSSRAEPSRDPNLLHHRLGDFELIRELGRGGMGIVHEARQVSLNRPVALKVLPPGLGLTAQAVQRFHREAQAAAKLHHTHIVPVYAVGEEQGCHFYAMELINGQPLAEILRELSGEGKNALFEATVTKMTPPGQPHEPKLSPATRPAEAVSQAPTSLSDTASGSRRWFDTVAKLMAEVAEALHYAHGHGIVHRDIKPANLMLSTDGKLCVTDFGLAQVAQEPGMTVSGSLMGTPAYMSPEQVAAGRVKIDHRTDVYSLGTVLYEMLTLRRPFGGESREEVLSGILTKEPRPPRRVNPRVPLDLETICLKAIEKDPDRRYATAGLLAEDLRSYLSRGLIAARRASMLVRSAKLVRRHPIIAVTVVAAILLVGTAGVAWRMSRLRAAEAAGRLLSDARLDMSEGRYREALRKVDSMREGGTDLPAARLSRARLLIKLGRGQEAADEARAVLETDPGEWTAHLVIVAASRGSQGRASGQSIEEHLKEVEKHAPDTSDAHYLRSLVADSAAEALEHLDRSLELDPGNADALIEKIAREKDLYRFADALADCDRLIAVRPRSSQARLLKAEIRNQLNDSDKALAEIAKALELDPEDARIYRLRGEIRQDAGKKKEALADYTRAIELSPNDPGLYSSRADLHDNFGQAREARADLEKALELNPEDPLLYQSLFESIPTEERSAVMERLAGESARWADVKSRADAHACLAYMYTEMEQYDKARAEGEESVRLDPEAWEHRLIRARARRLSKDEEGFNEDCTRVASLDLREPRDLWIRAWKMDSVCARPDVAIADLTKAIDLAPSWATLYARRAAYHERFGRRAEGIADYTKAISLAPNLSWSYPGRGMAYLVEERFSEALADFDKYVQLQPEDPKAYWVRAKAFFGLNRIQEGFTDLTRSIELAPSAWGYDDRSWMYLQLGRVDDALRDADKAIELEPYNGWWYARRAFLWTFKPGQCERAAEDLRKAAELMRTPGSVVDLQVAWLHVAGYVYACPAMYDPRLALEKAEKAPPVGKRLWDQLLLGIALYRNARYQEAIQVVKQAESFDPSRVNFVVAMAEHRLGRTQEARSHYDRAVAWFHAHTPNDPQRRRFKEEAAKVLGIGRAP